MRRFCRISFAGLLLTLCASAQMNTNTQGGNFKGQVRYETNTPASYIKVELWSDGGTWRSTVTTDDQGRFAVQAPFGVIQYKVEVPGYHPSQGREDLSMSHVANELLTLKALPGTIPPGASVSAPPDPRIAATPPEAKREFDAGQKAVDANDFAGAIPHLQKAVELYPKYAEAYQLLGVAQLQTQHGPEAEASLNKAIAIEDKMPQAQYMLGMLLAMTGRVNLAEKPFTRFVELDPANPDAYFELAKTEFALNKFREAELQANKAVELKEKNPGVQVVLAYSLLRQKKSAEAKAAFQQYLKLDPNSPMKADVEKTIAMIDEHEKQGKQPK
jgi:Flp pilus assembly protein TadD